MTKLQRSYLETFRSEREYWYNESLKNGEYEEANRILSSLSTLDTVIDMLEDPDGMKNELRIIKAYCPKL